MPEAADPRALAAAAELYHDVLTGLLLHLTSRAGARRTGELVFRLFRRKQEEQFLPGIEKLGLGDLPDAVAAAQYHYLSNFLGGVRVEVVVESDRKAWVRYPPPRWIWQGPAIAGIPSEVSAAMLRGWHANNGVLLGNPRLGFVCTKQTVDGQPGLEGYFLEHERELEPDERLRFARGEEAPPFDPATAPELPAASWPEARRQKAYRNYAMDYVKTAWLEAVDLFGPAEGSALAGTAAQLIGLQSWEATVQRLAPDQRGPSEGRGVRSARDFAELFVALARGQGDEVELAGDDGRIRIRQTTWRLMRGAGEVAPEIFEAWNRLWIGMLASHDRFLRWQVLQRLDLGDDAFEWEIVARGGGPG